MELMAGAAVLLGVVVLGGMLLSTATRAGHRSAADSTLHEHLDQAAEVIRRDLEKTDPARGVLGIARVDIRAAETAGERGGGYHHRADVLTVFTGQAFEPRSPGELSPPIERAPMSQVVYGHANFAKRSANGEIVGAVRLIDRGPGRKSEIPASQWYLARRVVGFPRRVDPRTSPGKAPGGLSVWPTAPGFLNAQWDLHGDPWEDTTSEATLARSVGPQIPKGLFRFYGAMHAHFFLDLGSHAYRADSIFGSLLEGGYWWKRGETGWERVEEDVTHAGGSFEPAPRRGDPVFDWIVPVNLFYGGSDTRTIVDSPPATEPARAPPPYLLPRCSEFRVEYTSDDPQEILINPDAGDPAADPVTGGPKIRPIRWWSPEPEQALVWSKLPVRSVNYGTSPPQSVKNRTDMHVWPRALRITIKAWDPAGRLKEPATRVIIHVWEK